ncbi:MAG: SRPBCC family protein [Ardenticatenaceae bacterium]|nr:SRPBCC family protein [Ardenticatenaceae bacterium]
MQDQVTKSIIVKGDAADVYRLWANFENFPNFMKYIKSVTKTSDRTSHWVMEGPLGRKVEWDAETTRLEENKRVAWNSTSGDIKTSGQVTFNPLPHGETQVTVILQYVPSAGMAGKIVAELFGDPEGKLADDLRNFKAYTEGMPERTAAKE